MILKEITLRSFRNYKNLNLKFSKEINVLYGKNGSGKTNILEAIYMLGNGISFRTRLDKEIVLAGEENYSVRGIFKEEDINYDTTLDLIYSKKTKNILIDKKQINSRKELIGRIVYTLFLPGDTELVLSEPKIRRDYFNMFISNISKEYLNNLIKYTKLLKLRNAALILKPKEAFIYNKDIAYLSMFIIKENEKYIASLVSTMNEIYTDIFKSKTVCYNIKYKNTLKEISSEADYIKKLESTLDEQIKMKTTFFGPHRSEYDFFYKDTSTKKFASQGEKRMFTLIMRLASEKIISDIKKSNTILLIDDAMLELDKHNRNSILDYIKTRGQVFITITEKDKLNNFESASTFDIENLNKN